jgi:hypothetical protein
MRDHMAPTPLDRNTIAGAFQTIARADIAEVLDGVESLVAARESAGSLTVCSRQYHLGTHLRWSVTELRLR